MSQRLSRAWADVFPGPRVADVLSYVLDTWDWLSQTYQSALKFEDPEPALTDSLCEGLNDRERRYSAGMDCDFQAETWELRRLVNGRTKRVGRADIRVILGVPGTPHLVLEFKKLDGSADARRKYCFDGMIRFVEGKYAVGHKYGVMCGITCGEPSQETGQMAAYIAVESRAKRLGCLPNAAGRVVTSPSTMDPSHAQFDTLHSRAGAPQSAAIALLHMFIGCNASH